MSQIKGRLTYKKLVDWVNEQFIKFEITEFEAYKAHRTYFRSDDYSGGACKLHVYFRLKDETKRHPMMMNDYFMCFYFLHEYKAHIDKGYEMYICFKRNGIGCLNDIEINLRKK